MTLNVDALTPNRDTPGAGDQVVAHLTRATAIPVKPPA
jgi:hypothetical protein